MKLINNEVVDFLFAMNYFANRNKQPENSYKSMPELVEWCDKYEKKLSPFLLNDISLIVEKSIFTSIFLFSLFSSNLQEIENVDGLLLRLKELKPEEFLEILKMDFMDGKEQKITIELLKDIFINKGLHPGYDPSEEAELLYTLLQDVDSFLQRLYQVYCDFYNLVYKPGHTSILGLEQQKLEWHQNRLDIDSVNYLRQVGLSNFVNSLKEDEEPTLYFSFFSDTMTSTFWKKKIAVIGAGTDQRILNRSARDKSDEFFSCFGDPKRLEILRLTAKRPWYSSELAKHFGIRPATLSYHINILVDAELLNFVNGKSRRFYYTLNRKILKEYLGFVAQDLLGLDYAEEK